jgi:hypothetical protein
VEKLPGGGLGRSIDPEWNLEWETWGFPKEYYSRYTDLA